MTSHQEKTAISVKGLYKDFKLPHERRNSLKERILTLGKKNDHVQFNALQDINFEIKKGEFFGIVGRNGSGKSTLLKIMGGIYQPTRGKLHINGTLTPFIELGIGFNPELTGRENVFLNGAILGLTRKEILEKYDQIVEFAELENFMDQKLKNYSSGMQVRLAFSIAIRAHNDILLIDEVLAVGDANFQRKCFKVFREIKNSGKTVVFVTHAMEMVQEFCDRALMIQDSKIVALGDPREIAARYELANSASGVLSKGIKLQRPKNPAVEIKKITLKRNDKPSTRFSLKDKIVAEVEVFAKKETELQMNFFLIGSNDEYAAGINTYKAFGELTISKGMHTFECTIDAAQLVKDTYSVGVGVYTWDDVPDIIDIVDRAYETEVPQITIEESSTYQDGKFYLQGNWRKL